MAVDVDIDIDIDVDVILGIKGRVELRATTPRARVVSTTSMTMSAILLLGWKSRSSSGVAQR